MITVPNRGSFIAGLKVTLITQLDPGLNCSGQVLVSAKSMPETVMSLISKRVLLVFVRVLLFG